ncbi:hypothetical protein N474_01070 [Pseudoalteromonas luteoviolacea CPMOR-2]|uniref:AMP-binding protein n=1 Tax=Pseudoalteromonas luteoviolacea TaxID=43657 RepID=UPI0007B04955|nr:AMP-binding protein [Pseudoalteromonas luteoviolacea]KZN55555.1 hypothetical protein N474_01070 [Pseudoalteromonas luteoviolacea CPMOR-2]
MSTAGLEKKTNKTQSLGSKVYWKKQLDKLTGVSRIPYDLHGVSHDEGQNESPRSQATSQIEASQFAYVWQLAGKSHHTLHLLLMAGWHLMVNKYSGSKDIAVATPGYSADSAAEQGRMLVIRNSLAEAFDVRELLTQIQEAQVSALKNQTLSYEAISQWMQDKGEGNALRNLVDSAIILDNIQDMKSVPADGFSLVVKASQQGDLMDLSFDYDKQKYSAGFIQKLGDIYGRLLVELAKNVNQKLADISLCSEQERDLILNQFNRQPTPFDDGVSVADLVAQSAAKNPNKVALTHDGEQITYAQLEQRATHIAQYLCEHKKLAFEERVGLIMDRSIDCFAAILGIMKAGGAYVPINDELSNERIVTVLDNAQIRIVFSQAKQIKRLNELQWQGKTFDTFICLDTDDVLNVEEAEQSELMSQQLWHYIGENATDDITGGGWFSSYTGDPIPREEMGEYRENTLNKLEPYLGKDKRILEIGCASGITMFSLAPKVGFYMGTDLSEVIIGKNQERVDSENIDNIKLAAMPAHQISEIEEQDFDVIVINSVIQDFHGHNYLRQVIDKAVAKLGNKGIIFVGDVMDQDRKEALIADLTAYKQQHPQKEVQTKLDWSSELFVSQGFFEDLAQINSAICKVENADKSYTIENELTKFRYDTFIHVDKGQANKPAKPRNKYQDDLSVLKAYNNDDFVSPYKDKFDGNNLAYVIFTSGSTGVPKGAMIEHRGLVNHAQAKIHDMEMNQDSVVAQNASLYFDISVWQYFSALSLGASVHIYGNELILDPEAFLKKVIDDKISILEVVPSYLSVLLDVIGQKQLSFEVLRFLIVTGEIVKPQLVNAWLETFADIPVVNAYGPTEASDDITHHIMSSVVTSDRVSIGRPLHNMSVTIVDDNMNLCPVGVKGEICVAGVGVGRGYLNDPEKTTNVFLDATDKHPRTYKTGDIGAWMDDGTIDFFGRNDQQIKVRGFRVELGDIESAIRRHPAIKEVAVVANEGPNGHQLSACFVTQEDYQNGKDADALPDQIKRFVQYELPDYMVPSHMHLLDAMPLTANGKIDRKQLAKVSVKQRADKVEPEGELEIQIRQIWAETLDMDPQDIGVTDDFFEIGGNSISVLKIANQIGARTGINVSMGDMFLKKNIRELSSELQQETIMDDMRCIIKLNDCDKPAKAFFVHTADGTVYSYRNVAKLMNDTHSVYGVQARGLVDNSVLPSNHYELIGEYLNEILKIQPEGPYIIGGHCMGAYISYELVRLLEDMGKEVLSLVILDVPVVMHEAKIKLLRAKRKLQKPGSWAVKLAVKKDQYIHYAKDENIVRSQRDKDDNMDFREWKARIDENINQLVNYDYSSKVLIRSHITVVSAKEFIYARKTKEDWQKMTLGDVTYTEISGDHDSMFYPPNVAELHKALWLEKSDEKANNKDQ